MQSPSEPLRTHADRILAELWRRAEGASDAHLAKLLNVSHQTVNATCHRMATQGLIARAPENGTIINRALLRERPKRREARLTDASWFWEGNVQETAAAYLVGLGWAVVSMVDTASREQGTDIVLERSGTRLWVTVKGLPVSTAKTQAYTQARHYFAGALLDVVLWRQEAEGHVQFAVALPVFPTYQRLAKRARWLQEAVPFDFLWIGEDGTVRQEPGRISTA